jgi:hypothetical protein
MFSIANSASWRFWAATLALLAPAASRRRKSRLTISAIPGT